MNDEELILTNRQMVGEQLALKIKGLWQWAKINGVNHTELLYNVAAAIVADSHPQIKAALARANPIVKPS